MMPSTRLSGCSLGSSCCCTLRRALAEAVLQAITISAQSRSNRKRTASAVKRQTVSKERWP